MELGEVVVVVAEVVAEEVVVAVAAVVMAAIPVEDLDTLVGIAEVATSPGVVGVLIAIVMEEAPIADDQGRGQEKMKEEEELPDQEAEANQEIDLAETQVKRAETDDQPQKTSDLLQEKGVQLHVKSDLYPERRDPDLHQGRRDQRRGKDQHQEIRDRLPRNVPHPEKGGRTPVTETSAAFAFKAQHCILQKVP